MQLQEQLLAQLQGLIQFGSKISSQSNITQVGQFALDAREKNAGIRDTLAWLINQVNSDLQVERLRINRFTSLPAGSTAGDAELMDIRVGIDGSTYPNAGEAVRRQIENYRDVAIGDHAPTEKSVKVWVDTSKKTEADYFMLPEVRDDMTNTSDTWSGSKIRHEIDIATRDIYIGVSAADAVQFNAKLWIDTNPHNTFMLPEIDDEMVSRIDTWSSQKIAGELSKIRRELGLEA